MPLTANLAATWGGQSDRQIGRFNAGKGTELQNQVETITDALSLYCFPLGRMSWAAASWWSRESEGAA